MTYQAQMPNQMYQNQMLNQGGYMTNMYQQMKPEYGANSNSGGSNTSNVINTNTSNNNQGNSNNGEPQSLLPGSNVIIGKEIETNNGIINVCFEASTGSRTIINIPEDISIKEAIEIFAKKIKLNQKYIGKEVIFVYTGKKIKADSNDSIKTLTIHNQSVNNVFDQANVLGA
jgi:hypothetical protein